MDHARDHLFAGARFSRDADGGVGIRDLYHLLQQGLHGSARRYDVLQPVEFFDQDLQALDFAAHALLCQGLLDRGA